MENSNKQKRIYPPEELCSVCCGYNAHLLTKWNNGDFVSLCENHSPNNKLKSGDTIEEWF